MTWLSPLCEAVQQHWANTGKAFNLAKAQPLLKKNTDLELHLQGRKIKDAIQEDAQAELRLVRDPQSGLTWGLVPRDVEIPADAAELFRVEASTRTAVPTAQTIRYGRGVWAAFSKPLKPGTRRFLEIGPPSKCYDIVGNEPLPPAGLEVPEGFIYGQNPELVPNENRDLEIEKNIRDWASSKGIDVQNLSAGRSTLERRHAAERSAGFDVLDFSLLNDTEKARILIPLDLLNKIRFGR